MYRQIQLVLGKRRKLRMLILHQLIVFVLFNIKSLDVLLTQAIAFDFLAYFKL